MTGALRLDVVTIFPDYLRVLDLSLIGKAAATGLIDLRVHDLRDWTQDRHRTVDGTPVGGGAGMVMRADVWGQALDAVLAPDAATAVADASGGGAAVAADAVGRRVLVVPTPAGEVFTQRTAEDLARADQIVFACGRYEGIDARVAEHYRRSGLEVRELSIGDYVLNGGEVATLVMVEAIARLRPGVLGNPESVEEESHSVAGLLEYPVYTRPIAWRGLDLAATEAPLLSGDHARVARHRRDQSLTRTAARRPDLVAALDPARLDREDRAVLARCGWAVPPGSPHPVPLRLRPATAADLPELTRLAARTFPDACPPGLEPASISAHTAQALSPERFAAWLTDPRAHLTVATLPQGLAASGPQQVGPGTGPGRAAGGQATGGGDSAPAGGEPAAPETAAPEAACAVELAESAAPLAAGALVGYSLVLLGQPGAPGGGPEGLDPLPDCLRPQGAEPVAELSKLYLDPRLRGSGLGPALLEQAVAAARTAGARRLWLGTHTGNRRAQKAYKRAGFRRAGTRVYDVGGQRCHDVVMVQELSAATAVR